jgi:CheY-like chemotaxis protein
MQSLRIFIVEDDALIALLLEDVLGEMGHEVCGSESGEGEAIAAALRCKPDLMIVDEHLGQGSGMAVVDAVLRNGAVPHLFVSGDARRIRALRPDAIVIEKPFFEVDLARAIQRAMAPELAVSSREHATRLPAEPPNRL